MANELLNIIVSIITSVILGMVLHSALGHTYHDKLWLIFHEPDKRKCYGISFALSSTRCSICEMGKGCMKKCRTSTE